MKLEEAINILRNFKLDMRQPNAFCVIEAIGIVENILKEIQQYREIRTVEEYREAVKCLSEIWENTKGWNNGNCKQG